MIICLNVFHGISERQEENAYDLRQYIQICTKCSCSFFLIFQLITFLILCCYLFFTDFFQFMETEFLQYHGHCKNNTQDWNQQTSDLL